MAKKFSTIEETFVMIKPDGVSRGLVGRIFQRFEEAGFKLVAARMIKATQKQAADHYPGDNEKWLRNLGDKTMKNYNDDLKGVKRDYGTTDTLEMGKIIYKKMMEYIASSPVIIMVWEGNHAIERIRSLVGSTVPTFAEVGSLRGSYAVDTPALASQAGRITFKTLIHTSDSVDEAKREIDVWFKDKFKALNNYERIDYVDLL
jgi:nucleoside-diphosphate kinase